MKALKYLVIPCLVALCILAVWRTQSEVTTPVITPSNSPTAQKQGTTAKPAAISSVGRPPPSALTGAVTLWENGVSGGISKDPHAATSLIEEGRFAVFEVAKARLSTLKKGSSVQLPLVGGMRTEGVVNYAQIDDRNIYRVAGNIGSKGTFYLAANGDALEGQILLEDQPYAYLVASADGEILTVKEVPKSKVICDSIPRPNFEAAAAPSENKVLAAPPLLSSRPDAPAVIYLDFDGETITDPSWNGGQAINAAASNLNSDEIAAVWQRVKEDYWPFNIDVTTSAARYQAVSSGHRMRVIITPTSSWYSASVGGVALVDSFSSAGTASVSATVPAFVFNTSVVGVAEAVSHEVGHTLGLHHDGLTTPATEYYEGSYGPVSWGPIMGASYYKALVQWSRGDYTNANQKENDIAIITSSKNGFGYVADDYGDTIASATKVTNGGSASITGTISSDQDVDVFSITVPSSTLSIIVGGEEGITNLDAAVDFLDANGTLIERYDNRYALSGYITRYVQPGTYYIRVSGASSGDVVGNGYSDGYPAYGSIGAYTLSVVVGDPPTAPTIATQPTSTSSYSGGTAQFSVNCNGTYPLSFQWQKDGVSISGANGQTLYFSNLNYSDAASYRVIVSNSAGSVTSTAASLTVTAPAVPAIVDQPDDATIETGNSVSLGVGVTSQVTVTYQWFKDGVALPSATNSNLYIYNATTADSGIYTVVVTNAGGSVTSRDTKVKINPASPPVVSGSSSSVTLEVGESFSAYVYFSSSTSATIQWYRGDTPLTGQTWTSLYLSNLTVEDAGIYVAVVSNAGGWAKSPPVKVIVRPPHAPEITSQPTSTVSSVGSNVGFSVSVKTVGTTTYQWYRNGSPIDGANSSYLSLQISGPEFGEYYVKVSNDYGSTVSDLFTLQPSPNSSLPGYMWKSAVQYNGVAYFLFKNPARISRYSLTNQTWLSDWKSDIGTATAMAVGNNEVYIAFGRAIYKFTPDAASSTGSLGTGTPFANVSNDVLDLQLSGSQLIAAYPPYQDSSNTTVASYNKSTKALISSQQVYGMKYGFSLSSSQGRLFATGDSYQGITSLKLNSDGTFGAAPSTGYLYDNGVGGHTFALNNASAVIGDNGIIYNGADMTPLGSVGGALQDFVEASPSVNYLIRGSKVRKLDAKYHDVGYVALDSFPYKLMQKGSYLFAFGQCTGLGQVPPVQVVATSSVQVDSIAESPAPGSLSYNPTKIILGSDNIVYILDQQNKALYRWSTSTGAYLKSVSLPWKSLGIDYNASAKAVFIDDAGYNLLKLSFEGAQPALTPVYVSPLKINGFASIGNKMMVSDASGPWYTHWTVSLTGEILASKTWYDTSLEYVWNDTKRRLYFMRGTTSPSGACYEPIDANGVFGDSVQSSYYSTQWQNPLRVSPNGNIVLNGSGNLYDAGDLSLLGSLSSSVSDGDWFAGNLFTIREVDGSTVVEKWAGDTYLLGASLKIGGLPLRVLPLNNGLLVITSVNGVPTFNRVNPTKLLLTGPGTNAGADFDGDGRADVLSIDEQTGSLAMLQLSSGAAARSELAQVGNNWRPVATGDFNQDGKADIVWEDATTGEHALWLMNGKNYQSTVSLGQVDPNWHVVGAADVNGDKNVDLIWQNAATSETIAWLMNGTSVAGALNIPSAPPEWILVNVVDLNADAKPDFVWRHRATGQLIVWWMDGINILGSYSYGVVAPEWSLVDVGDYNGDGSSDMLWSNSKTSELAVWILDAGRYTESWNIPAVASTVRVGDSNRAPKSRIHSDFDGDGRPDLIVQDFNSGKRQIWLMMSNTTHTAIDLGTINGAWTIAGSADFNNDGYEDLVWENTSSGERQIWQMRGTAVTATRALPTVGVDWHIVATGDFNSDGNSDLVWRNSSTGESLIWYLVGGNYVGSSTLGTVGTAWTIVGAADFNHDTVPDLLWFNRTTGEVVAWALDNGHYNGSAWLGSVPAGWRVAQVMDVDNDGNADIVWRNTTSGELVSWMMNGLQFQHSTTLETLSNSQKAGYNAAHD